MSRVHRVEAGGHDADEQRDGQQVLPRRIRNQHLRNQQARRESQTSPQKNQKNLANPKRTRRS